MEPTPVDVSPAASPSYRGTRGGPAAPPRAAAALAGGRLGRTALDLLRRAPLNLRRHVVRAVWRFVVLVIGDLAAFGLMRELIRGARERAWLGDALSAEVEAVLPSGTLSGWQFAAALFVSLIVVGSYGPGDRRRDAGRLFLACALATALPLWAQLWTRGFAPVLLEYGATVVLVWLGLVTERWTIHRLVAVVRSPARDSAPTLFVGPADECRTVSGGPAFASGDGYHAVGFVDLHAPPAADARGSIADFPVVLAASGAEAVVACGELTDAQFRDVVDAALTASCQVFSVPHAMEVAGVEPTFVWRQGQPLVQLSAPSLTGWQLLLKRLLDVVGASLGLVVAAPVMALIALAIKGDSPGPVLFRQERIGSGGRRFGVLKFRTMRDGVSDEAHRQLVTRMLRGEDARAGEIAQDGRPVFKLTRDDRVTRVGRWLRRTSLDELPQLFNVLRAEMSLVGPRPPLPYEFEAYDHWQFDRLRVLPGMTGLWQVSGRNLLTYRQMCELDVAYVRSWSLWLDIRILLRTVPVVLFNSGRAA